MKRIALLVLLVGIGATAAMATQDVADAWTAIQFTLPIPAPYGQATVSARTAGEGRAMRIVELTISYGKHRLAIPSFLLERLPSPAISTLQLYHPPQPFDSHYYLTLSLEFGDPSKEAPFDFPRASFDLKDGKVVGLSVLGDLSDEELNELQWVSDGN